MVQITVVYKARRISKITSRNAVVENKYGTVFDPCLSKETAYIRIN